MLKRLVLPLLAAISLFLTACQMPNLMPGSSSHSPQVQLSWNLGRTILPTSFPTADSYEVVLTSTDQTPVTLNVTSNSVTLNDLAKAIWTATVTAKNAATTVASGAVDIDLTGTDTASATVTLRYVASGAGTGQIHLNLDLAAAPDVVAAVEATLIDPAGAVSYPKVTLNGTSASLEVPSAKAGSQNLFLVVKTLTKTAMKQESVLVLAGGDTVGSLTLTADDFDSSYVKYLYSGAGTADFTVSADDWGTGTTIDNAYTGDSTYTPVIKLTSNSGAWGTPIGFNDISPKGILAEFTGLKLKVKATGFTSLKVKLPGAGKEEVTYTIAEGKALADGWTQLIIPFSDFNGVPATLNQVGIFGPGSGTAPGSTILLADIGFTGQAAVNAAGLTAAITAATALNTATVVGTGDGNVNQATHDAYAAAITTAEAAPVTGWPQINAALTALDTATKAFNSGILHLVPTSLAPAPTSVAANVISLLNTSGTYTDVAIGNWNPNWGQTGSISDATVAGKTVKVLNLKNYQGVNISSNGEASGTGVLDVSGKPMLHLSYWSANGTSFNVYPIANAEAAIPVTVSTRNAWTDLEIDLTQAAGIDLTKLRQLKFDGGSGQVYYLDNIYFHTNPVTALSVDQSTVSVSNGATKTVVLTGTTATGTKTVTDAVWTSSDATIATATGSTISGVAPGTAVLTATKDGVTATVNVTVNAVTLTSLTASQTSVTTGVGATKTIVVTGNYSDASTATVADSVWSSSDTSVATVANGVITGVSVGTSTVTATKGAQSVNIAVTIVGAVPIDLPAAPILASSRVISLYNSSVTYTDVPVGNWNPGWGQGGDLTDVTVAGKTVKKLRLVNYQGINVSTNGGVADPGVLDVSANKFLHLSYWTPDGTSFRVFPINATGESPVTVSLSTQYAWTDVEIDLSAAGISLTTLRQLKFDQGSGQTYYLDNIYFHD